MHDPASEAEYLREKDALRQITDQYLETVKEVEVYVTRVREALDQVSVTAVDLEKYKTLLKAREHQLGVGLDKQSKVTSRLLSELQRTGWPGPQD